MGKPNLVLTGFMGTGKTSVGGMAAQLLGLEFVDMDVILEERFGIPISQVFREKGEAAFRQEEAELVRELAGREGLVIATGGGALVSDANRRAFLTRGAVAVCLDCEAEVLAERLVGVRDRPLLDAPDRTVRIRELLAARKGAYARIPYHVDTTNLSMEEVARKVVGLYRGKAGEVTAVRTPSGSYNIHLKRGILGEAGPILKGLGLGRRLAIVTNPNIPTRYAEALVESLAGSGLEPRTLYIPEGEAFKTLDTVRTLYDGMLDAGLDRGSAVIALGGGVVGDVAGFAAATFLRGIALVQAPTTLLAMVDSSIGGKVGVDLPRGKNLIGSFKEPIVVLADPETLASLPPEELCSGMAEVVKHGLIGSPALFEHLERRGTEGSDWMVGEALRVKVRVVEEDPYEQGRRAILNLGHTFGHALEAASGFAIRHGEAVSLGMLAAARTSVRMKLCGAGLSDRVEALLKSLGLPTSFPAGEPEAVLAAMRLDKKVRGGKLRFILLKAVGEAVICDRVPAELVREEVERICGK